MSVLRATDDQFPLQGFHAPDRRAQRGPREHRLHVQPLATRNADPCQRLEEVDLVGGEPLRLEHLVPDLRRDGHHLCRVALLGPALPEWMGSAASLERPVVCPVGPSDENLGARDPLLGRIVASHDEVAQTDGIFKLLRTGTHEVVRGAATKYLLLALLRRHACNPFTHESGAFGPTAQTASSHACSSDGRRIWARRSWTMRSHRISHSIACCWGVTGARWIP